MPFSDQDADAVVGNTQQRAGLNLSATRNIPPAAAQQALTEAPSTGIPGSVGMYNPTVGGEQYRSQNEGAILASHPGVAAFAAKSPAHAAAISDDLPAMGTLDDTSTLAARAWEGYQGPLGSIGTAFSRQWSKLKADAIRGYQTPSDALGLPRLGADVLGFAGIIPLASAGDILERSLAGLPIDQYGGGPSLEHPFAPYTKLTTPEERRNLAGQTLTPALFAVGSKAGAEGAAAPFEAGPPGEGPAGAQRAASPPYEPPPPSSPGHVPTDENGFVLGPDGKPMTFASQRQAGKFAFAQHEGSDQIFDMAVAPGTGQGGVAARYGVIETGRMETPTFSEVPPPGYSKETDQIHEDLTNAAHDQVKQLEDAVAGSKTFSTSPGLVKEFLDDKGLGDVNVYIKPDVLISKVNWSEPIVDKNAAAISSAFKSGQDVAIPLSEYLTSVAGKPYADELRAATTFFPGGASKDDLAKLSEAAKGLPGEPAAPAPEGGVVPADHQEILPEHIKGEQTFTTPEGHTYYVSSYHDGAFADVVFHAAGSTPQGSAALSKEDLVGYLNEDGAKLNGPAPLGPQATPPPGPVTPENKDTLADLGSKIDTAIHQVAQETGTDNLHELGQLFASPKAAGMKKGQFARHAEAVHSAFENLKTKTFERVLKRLTTSYRKEWNEAYQRNVPLVSNEVLSSPGMVAQHILRYSAKEDNEITKNNAFAPGGKPIVFFHKAPTMELVGKHLEDLSHLGLGTETLNPVLKAMNYNVISFSTSARFVHQWQNNGNVIFLVHLKAEQEKVGDYRKAEDVQKALNWFEQHPVDQSNKNGYSGNLKRGSWIPWEYVPMQKANGWEATWMMEDGALNANVQRGDMVYVQYRAPLYLFNPDLGIKYNELPQNIRVAFSEAEFHAEQRYFEAHKALGMTEVNTKLATSEKEVYPDLVNSLPKNIWGKEGISADQAADLAGHGSGREMLEDMATMERARGSVPFRQWVQNVIRDKATTRTLAEVGNLLDKDRIYADAKAAFVEPTIEDLLVSQLRDLAEQQGLPFNEGDIKSDSVEVYYQKPVKEALNLKVLEKGMKTTGEAVEEALQKGKAIDAFQAKQQQLRNFYQLQEAHKFAAFHRAALRQLNQLRKKGALKSLDFDIGAVIHKLIEDLHIHVSRDPEELIRYLNQSSIPDPLAILTPMEMAGIPVVHAELTPELKQVNGPVIPKMPGQLFKDYIHMITGLAEVGRNAKKVEAGAKQQELTALADEVTANAGGIGAKYTAQQLADRRRGVFNRTKSRVKSLLIGNLRPEVYWHWLDGDKQGPLMTYGVNPLMEGKYKETDLTNAWVKAMKAFPGAKEVMTHLDQGITAPEELKYKTALGPVDVIKTRGDLLKAAAHLGSISGRDKLLRGYGWSEDAEDWILENLTKPEVGFLREFFKQNDKLFKLADAMQMRVRGYGLKEDIPRPMETNFGTLPGGHIHITYQSALKALSRLNIDTGDLISQYQAELGHTVMDKFPASAMPSAFYSINRTNYAGPVDLDWRTFSSGVAEVIHDIAFREALIQAQKIFTDPRVQLAAQTVLGPEYAVQALPWLKYIAQERMLYDPASDGAAQLIRQYSNNIVWSKVAFSLAASLKHGGVGLSHMIGQAKNPASLIQAAVDLTGVGGKAQSWRDFVKENSGEVRGLALNVDNSLRDAMQSSALSMSAADGYKKAGYFLFTISKVVESHITWLASYREAMSEVGDHEIAVNTANKAVRDTQGAGAPVDIPRLFRHGGTEMAEAAHMLTNLMSFRSTSINRAWTANRLTGLGARQIAAGNIGTGAANVGKAANAYTFFFTLAALWVAFMETDIQGQGDRKKTKTQNFEESLFWNLLGQGPGSMPGVALGVDAAHYARQGGSSDMFSSVPNDLEKASPRPNSKGEWKIPHHEVLNLLLVFGELSGYISATEAHAVQAMVDKPEDLQPEEQTKTALFQRAVLGRSTHYLPPAPPPFHRGHRS